MGVLGAVSVVPLLWRTSSARHLMMYGLALDFLGGVFIAVDGVPPVHDVYDRGGLVMPWRAINAGLAKIAATPDASRPALAIGDEGFEEIVTAIRRFHTSVPEPARLIGLSGTVAIHRVLIYAGSVTVNNKSHPIEPLAGIVLSTNVGPPIVIGSESNLRTWIERYRLSWFVTHGLAVIVAGFFWQFLAVMREDRTSPKPAEPGPLPLSYAVSHE
jgi:hypothetical protein